MTDPRVSVLYVLGAPRSGTTLLGNALGSVEGIVHVGELRHVWRAGAFGRPRCGCGEMFDACPMWEEAFRSAELTRDDLVELSRRHPDGWHSRLRIPAGRPDPWADYARTVERVYISVAAAAKARLVIDTSKDPKGCSVLARMTRVERYCLLLLRDPRGVAYSRQRALIEDESSRSGVRVHHVARDMRRWRSAIAAARWARRAFGPDRVTTVRYEEFAEQPKQALSEILQFARMGETVVPMPDERTLSLATNHTCGGNRNRFATGEVAVRTDERWRTGLSPLGRASVRATTWPIARRLGYA